MDKFKHLLIQYSDLYDTIKTINSRKGKLKAVNELAQIENNLYATPNSFEKLLDLIFLKYEIISKDSDFYDPNYYDEEFFSYEALKFLAGFPEAKQASLLFEIMDNHDVDLSGRAKYYITKFKKSKEFLNSIQKEISRQEEMDEPSIKLRILIEALIRQRDKNTIPFLLNYINDGSRDEEDRIDALELLVTLIPEWSIPIVEEMAKEVNDLISLNALGLSAVYGNEESYNKLLTYELSKDDEEVLTALKWLGRIPRIESNEILLKWLKHPDYEIRICILEDLEMLGYKEGFEAIIEHISDDSETVIEKVEQLITEAVPEDVREEFDEICDLDETRDLTERSRNKLIEIGSERLKNMGSGKRYNINGVPLKLEDSLDRIYNFLTHYRTPTTWYHWIASTGMHVSFEILRNVLESADSLQEMEDWFEKNKNNFKDGCTYYNGREL